MRSFVNKFILGAALFVIACSNTETAGGGPSGSEAGNAITALTAQIFDIDKKPAAKAKVTILERNDLEGTANAFETETDEDGFFAIEDLEPGSYTLEINGAQGALQKKLDFKTIENLKLENDTLKEKVSVKGHLKNDLTGHVKIRGLNHSAKVLQGEFTFDELPAGPLSLVFIPEAGDTLNSYIHVEPGEKQEVSSFATEQGTLLFEDFEDLDKRKLKHRFAPLYSPEGGWWYFAHSENAVSNFDSASISMPYEFPIKNTDSGKAAYVKVDFLEDGDEYHWANLGVQLADKLETVNLSAVDSITFDAAGSGNVRFQILEEITADSALILLEAEVSLNEDKVHFGFALQDFKEVDFSRATMLSWVFIASAELLLDDIKFVGARRQEIWNDYE